MLTFIPISSRPIFSVKGALPTATRTQSKLSLVSSEKLTTLLLIFVTDVDNLKSTPLEDNCFLSSPDVLLSNPGKISLSSSTTVTSEPKSFNKLANSQPIAPAPITQTFFGGSSQLSAVSDVITNSPSTFMFGISLGFDPVAKRM